MRNLSSNIIFAIVPGAWHPSSIYTPLVSQLQAASHDAVVTTYPSSNSASPMTATCTEDAKSLRKQFTSLIEDEGKNLVVVSHSYGGVPAAGAAYGLSVKTRAQDGKRGGVLGLVYMSAFLVSEGESLLDIAGGKHAPFSLTNMPCEGLVIISPAVTIETLFNDVDPEVANSLSATLVPLAMLAFESPAPPSVWTDLGFESRFAFLKCRRDQALPLSMQEMLTEKSGLDWKIKEIDAGHSPYLSRPKECFEALIEFTTVFSQV